MALPNKHFVGAVGNNPYWARNSLMFGQAVQPITGALMIFVRGSGGRVGLARDLPTPPKAAADREAGRIPLDPQ